MAMEQEARRPYGPPSNVVDLLHRFRDRNIPARIDTPYLVAAGISENLVALARNGLMFLGLISDDGSPTDILRRIATSTDEEYRGILEGQLRSSYEDVFEIVDPAKDEAAKVFNVFRRFMPASQRNRMVSFFLALCRESGIEVVDSQRQRNNKGSSGKRSAIQPRRTLPSKVDSVVNIRDGRQTEIVRESGNQVRIPAGLRLLLDLLPPEGNPLSAERRDQWLVMAREALKFAYPENVAITVRSDPKENGSVA